MITPDQLRGTGVALITPFNSQKEIDFEALENMVNYVIRNQVDFLVALGTTSEAATLSDKEKQEVVKHIIKTNDGRLPIILGMGGNNTTQLVDTINLTNFEGIDGILSVAPYYNKPTQEGLYQHFKAVAEASPVPIILYNVPSRTASNIEANTTLRLANEFDNIIAVKEASGNFEQIMDIIKNRPDGFMVLSGDDATTLPLVSLGADGVISVIANGFPFEFSQMVREAHNNAYEEARKLHYKMTDIIKDLFAEGNPAGIKAILHARGLIQNNLRLPLVTVSEDLYKKLGKQLNDF
ncbi:4-hydroxy-tetrahydrodipicolinate synthase [Carboxylicivirga sp. N1Y90]|uniref:4-hydroxy-tetrahydrodipicolinate synthase n=1 Tax=Carboxylicivirga fragile TaxID=3417571 RepID=UPI003D32FF9B|nr:4-hydroxy-tetrahydrodipicolinate synthase [Marinilabiliaceae bacterium N1Y90]